MPAATALILPLRLRKGLLAQALATPRVEVCALLGGRGNRLISVYPVRNIAADPATGFLLEAEGQIKAMRQMRTAGESMRAIFHSHPATAAVPSATDRQLAAYPAVYYLVLSLSTRTPVLGAYYYDGRDFTPVDIRSS